MNRLPLSPRSAVYCTETYLRAAQRIRTLAPHEHHSCLDPERLAIALERAAERPMDTSHMELLDSLPLIVYVPVT